MVEDWMIKKLGEVAKNITTGKKNNEEKQDGGKYPFFVRSQQVERINSYSYDGEAIIVPGEGNIGQIFHYINGKFDFHQRVYKISEFADDVNGKFVFYQMKFSFGQYALVNTVKATVDSLRLPTFQKFMVGLPPTKTEQTAIATVLSDMDGYIASLDKLIAKKRAIKQGAIQELLTGKRRLPGFEGEWVEIALEDILDYEQPTNYIVHSEKYKTVGIPVLTAGKTFVLGYTPETTGIYTNLPVILFDDFLTISRYINFPFKVKSSAVKMLKPKRIGDNLKLIFELMQILKFEIFDHKRYWISQFSKLKISMPEKHAEQSAIAAVLSDMDTEIEALTAKLNKAKSIKQGMMQELLTGRIRLVKPEANIAPVIKAVEKLHHGYSEDDKDAVILGTLTNQFGTEQHPFTAFDCQKFPYLFHRCVEGTAKGYKKFAAGPYNPDLKYRTARPIALKKRYIRECTGHYTGFVADENIQEALKYFAKWYGDEPLKWLEQFRYIKKRKEELELLTTVDMAMVELRQAGNPVTMHIVKEVIRKASVWKDKLTRPIFSDKNIFRAIEWSIKLFGKEE
jgi:type I restriction enzyme S subunit